VDALNSEVAAATGLPDKTPLVAGAGDQAASAVGTGIINEGIVSATLGTSGVVFAASDAWRVAPGGSLHAFCHAVPNTWHLMGVMLSAAGSYDWFGRALAPDLLAEAQARGENPFASLDERAASIEPGAEGLFFLPYLSGERTPHADPDARGCFIGLSSRHGRDHMARAVLEGVTFGMRDCFDLVRSCGVDPNEVRLSGGGAKSAFWRQLCADVFGCPTTTTTTAEGTAYGAALLAGVGGGIWKDVPAACEAAVHETDRTEHGPESALYEQLHERFAALYPALRPWWHSP
jgi:xylulokinase